LVYSEKFQDPANYNKELVVIKKFYLDLKRMMEKFLFTAH